MKMTSVGGQDSQWLVTPKVIMYNCRLNNKESYKNNTSVRAYE